MLSAVLARAKGEDDTKHLESLRDFLLKYPQGTNWDFTSLLAFIGKNISAADHALYSTLAARIGDPKQSLDNIDTLMRRRPKNLGLVKARHRRTALKPTKDPIHKRLVK